MTFTTTPNGRAGLSARWTSWLDVYMYVKVFLRQDLADFVRVEYPGGAVIVRRKPH